MQDSTILFAAAYGLVSLAMVGWGWFHVERRHTITRRIERIQQLVVVVHFVALAGWFLRFQIGLSERVSDPTAAGVIFEVGGVISCFAIAAISILGNPGVSWNRFFAIYGSIALIQGTTFGAIAIRWPISLGFLPGLEEVIHDKENFGTPGSTGLPHIAPRDQKEANK